ncbi:unnamed protein product [Rotaria sordida]|uniref:Uncharacterized protein n=1 Tax=Rotaria sordida TaxID=392033 RepID=A0A819MES5_9BILA|nr:unnamed protein product [Rotaria sordida]CAF3978586.1 unnamed protein product [Rotaria sordida]
MIQDITNSLTNTNQKLIIALDCDGVLLDYHTTFAQIYEKTFRKQLTIVSPNSYHARDMYGVQFTDEEKIEFNKIWDEYGWKTMPMYDGSLQACLLLHQAGYELVCVTAMPPQFVEHRLGNFRLHGFPIDKVISSGYDKDNFNNNPKRKIIEDLHPIVFVDDLRRNFKDIQQVHTKFIFIDNQCHDDPNQHDHIYYDIKYSSLLEFVQDFLKTEPHGQDISWHQRPDFLLPSN